jgi:hypothetical protein
MSRSVIFSASGSAEVPLKTDAHVTRQGAVEDPGGSQRSASPRKQPSAITRVLRRRDSNIINCVWR